MSQAVKLSPPDSALAIYRRLRDHGYEAYFCGGCVRDAMMGTDPKDYDITTSARPEEVEALFEKTVPVGKSFGVILVVVDEIPYEVATFRSDMAYVDGRRPEGVVFTTAREDVQRRDFTINALLYDYENETVVDYVEGLKDMEHGILRTVGDPVSRFQEDHLRLLRAVRFAARTGFSLHIDTRKAIQAGASTIRSVSGERVGEEVTRMLTEGHSLRAFSLLEETGLLPYILPEVARMRGVPQPEQYHPEGCVLTHTWVMLAMFDRLVETGLTCLDEPYRLNSFEKEVLGYAVLLHDIGKPQTLTQSDRIRFNEHDAAGAGLTDGVLRRLKRPRHVIEAVQSLIGRHMHFSTLQKMRKAKRRRWVQDPLFLLHLELHRMDCESSHGKTQNYTFGVAALKEEQLQPQQREPLLTGRDLMAMGFRPGPGMGQILRELEDAHLEGVVTEKEAARAWVLSRHEPE